MRSAFSIRVLRAPCPDATERYDLARHVTARADGTHELSLAVDGLQCGACVWLIEQVLAREPMVLQGRVNMTTRRLRWCGAGAAEQASTLVAVIERWAIGLVPFDPAALRPPRMRQDAHCCVALAVAGFAAGNVM